MENQRPKVGVGVIVKKDNKVLLGKRKNAHGEGSWCFAGGHLEFWESVEECAAREVEEEVGIKIKNIKQSTYTNDLFEKDKKHYVTIFVVADWKSGNVELREPEKCECWEWFVWDDLPSPLFLPIRNYLKKGINPFD
ncbi:NUDIX domain-containing protein [Patescibacteria group bacterium]|nr:NUDIX domain-containing protein [Patescibacteria group bacterium]